MVTQRAAVSLVICAAALSLGGVDREAATSPALPLTLPDKVLVRDDALIGGVYALHGMLLYMRWDAVRGPGYPAPTRPWMRVIDGRRLDVRGLPANAWPHSIGRDAVGRVVVVMGQDRANRHGMRWWLYDVARDTARPLRVRAHRGCSAENVAVWRSRVVFEERCTTRKPSHLVVSDGGRTTTIRIAIKDDFGLASLVLRGRSLAVRSGVGDVGVQHMWRVLDHGRRCPRRLAVTSDVNAMAAGISSHVLTWVVGRGTYLDSYTRLKVWDIDLSGRCQPSLVKRVTTDAQLQRAVVNDFELDGRTLYYTTDTEIHRVRLPGHGQAARRAG